MLCAKCGTNMVAPSITSFYDLLLYSLNRLTGTWAPELLLFIARPATLKCVHNELIRQTVACLHAMRISTDLKLGIRTTTVSSQGDLFEA